MITPVLKRYITEKNRIAFERQQKKIEKDGLMTSPVMTNSFYELRNWIIMNQMRSVMHLPVVQK